MGSTWQLNENSTGVLKTTVEGDVWKDAQEKATDKLVKSVKLDGFREGHVPKAMALKYVNKQQVLMDAIDLVAQEALIAGIKENDVDIIARPELGIDSIDENSVVFSFTITVKPEVKLGDYKGLDIKKEEVSVTDEDMDAQVKQLQEKFAELALKEDGKVEDGDTAVIDFEGFKDGVAFDGGKGENYPLVIGSGSFIPGFEEQLIGMGVEETKDLDITFPENYGAADLAGAAVVFKVTVHEIKTKELPELDDELVKMAEIKDIETVEAFKTFTKENLEAQKTQEADNKFVSELLETITANAEVEIPQVMIDDETDTLMNDFAQRLAQQGMNLDLFTQMTGQDEAMLREQMAIDAENKVKVNLVLEAIAKAEEVVISDEACEAEIANIAEMYKMEVEKVKSLISNEAIAYDLRNKKALDIVKENVK